MAADLQSAWFPVWSKLVLLYTISATRCVYGWVGRLKEQDGGYRYRCLMTERMVCTIGFTSCAAFMIVTTVAMTYE